jgi:hypothetical protein
MNRRELMILLVGMVAGYVVLPRVVARLNLAAATSNR